MIRNQRVAFIHPDLGIGGAEQLVVNLAVALQKSQNYVKIYTPHHDPSHSFAETNGQIPVEVRGNIVPIHIFGFGTAVFAYLRMLFCTIFIVLFGGHYDVIIVDQVTISLPLLWLFRKRTIFYCHYPDKLLCVQRNSFIKKIYRLVIDLLEEFCLLFATLVLVNSNFTREVVKQAFPIYTKFRKQPEVLYPAIDFSKFDVPLELARQDSRLEKNSYFISLNRFERKKNIGLAIHAFAAFKLNNKEDIRLVIAGGYDPRLQENIEHYEELQQLVHRLNLSEYISFKRNISDMDRSWLLKNSIAVLYTPEREHFGIVPVEAMYNEVPVIACNSGGPKESVLDQITGYLCESQVDVWAQRMKDLTNEKVQCQMGQAGKERVIKLFSFEQFQNQITSYVNMVSKNKSKSE